MAAKEVEGAGAAGRAEELPELGAVPATWSDVVEGEYVETGGPTPYRMHYLSYNFSRDKVPEAGYVVMVHGLGDFSYRYIAAATMLASKGYAVVTPDWPGRGRSVLREPGSGGLTRIGGHTREAYVECLWEFLKAVGIPLETPITLVGHSMGGAISASFADAHPEKLSRMVLLAPAGLFSNGMIGCLRCTCCCWRGCCNSCLRKAGSSDVEGVMRGDYYDPDHGANYEWQAQHFRLFSAHTDQGQFAFVSSVMEFPLVGLEPTVDHLATHWNKPTMIMWGANDTVCPTSSMKKWTDKLGKSEAALKEHLYTEAGHCFMLEQLESYHRDLAAWCDATRPAAGK